MLGRVLCPLVGVACAAANRVTIVAAGGVEAIVQGMQAHVGVAAVQEEGVGALHNLAAYGTLRHHWRCVVRGALRAAAGGRVSLVGVAQSTRTRVWCRS